MTFSLRPCFNKIFHRNSEQKKLFGGQSDNNGNEIIRVSLLSHLLIHVSGYFPFRTLCSHFHRLSMCFREVKLNYRVNNGKRYWYENREIIMIQRCSNKSSIFTVTGISSACSLRTLWGTKYCCAKRQASNGSDYTFLASYRVLLPHLDVSAKSLSTHKID